MDGQSLNLDGILQSVMQNPEMLKSAMALAGKLSEGGALSALFSPQEDAEAEETVALAQVPPAKSEAPPAKGDVRKRDDLWRHRKLLEALSLYVSEDKRDKFDLLLRLFDLVELAGNIKR